MGDSGGVGLIEGCGGGGLKAGGIVDCCWIGVMKVVCGIYDR